MEQRDRFRIRPSVVAFKFCDQDHKDRQKPEMPYDPHDDKGIVSDVTEEREGPRIR